MAWAIDTDGMHEDTDGKYQRRIYEMTPDGAVEDLNDLDNVWGKVLGAQVIGRSSENGAAEALIDPDDETNVILTGASDSGTVVVEVKGNYTVE